MAHAPGPRLRSSVVAGPTSQWKAADFGIASSGDGLLELFRGAAALRPDAVAVTSEPLEDPAEEAEEEEARTELLGNAAPARCTAAAGRDDANPPAEVHCEGDTGSGERADRVRRKQLLRRQPYELDYRSLEERVARLAARLRARMASLEAAEGRAAGPFVAICLDRTVALAVAVLGALAAGAAYVPLEPSHPGPRLRLLLEDSGAELLITCWCARRRALMPEHRCIRLAAVTGQLLTDDMADGEVESQAPDALPNWSGELAYLLYTSGSTGTPKGVVVPRRGVRSQLFAFERMVRRDGADPGDVLVALATICFDIAALELLWPLCFGFRLFIASGSTRRSPPRLARLLEELRPRIVQATPVSWRGLVQAGWSGHGRCAALCGGEAFPPALVGALMERCGGGVWNIYGPTETTLWCTAHAVHLDASLQGALRVPVGAPIDNMFVALVAPEGEDDEAGTAGDADAEGELLIGGVGVSLGYHNRADLTASRFVQWPRSSPHAGEAAYRSGDLMRLRHTARGPCLEFRGRLDFQVKFRGFRIELGEIESVLERHLAVHMAVCVLRALPDAVSGEPGPSMASAPECSAPDAREDRLALVAFVELSPGALDGAGDASLPTSRYFDGRVAQVAAGQLSAAPCSEVEAQSGLRAYLAAELPAYMVPKRVVVLPALPLSPNGKADRMALRDTPLQAAIVRGAAEQELGAQPSPTCSRGEVAGVIASVTGAEVTDAADAELAALGVDSTTATLLAEALSERFLPGREALPAEELFAHATLQSLCDHIVVRGGEPRATSCHDGEHM